MSFLFSRRAVVCLLSAVFALLLLPGLQAQTHPTRQPVLDVASTDNTVDPCDDFYAYACRGWLRNNPIPSDQTSWSVYLKLEAANLLLLRRILETAAAGQGPSNRKIGDYYAACMDEDAISRAGIKPLQARLNRIAAMQSKQDLDEVLVETAYDSAVFDVHSTQDYHNATEVIAELDEPSLGLPDRDFYLKFDFKARGTRKAYAAHVQEIFQLLGDAPETARQEARAVLRIETRLADGSMGRIERRDPQKVYHKTTMAELEALSPSFHWKKFFAAVGIPEVKSLTVTAPKYFPELDSTLRKEDLESWKSYLRWHLVHSYAAFLPPPFVEATFDFYGRTLQGGQALEPRWKRCVESVDDDLGDALGEAYVAQAFSPEAKQRALSMVKQIEKAMETEIESLDWMTPETKRHAVEKLHAVANKVGYPDQWRDYGSLTVSRDDAVGNAERARQFEFQRQVAKIGKPVDRGDWAMTPPSVNAYYDSQLNDINFPAGVLQPPLFDLESDDAPNFGDTGSTIGHELSHAFDDEGSQFDAQGNLRDWWSAEDARQFERRAACISHQYSHYKVVGRMKIKSRVTLGEDMSDLAGVLLAYHAWKQKTRNQALEDIDGLTPEQRFFVGYAQSSCSNAREEAKKIQAVGDFHSPDQYRINGVVSNLPEFQQAFHCKAGSRMVRKDPCKVW